MHKKTVLCLILIMIFTLVVACSRENHDIPKDNDNQKGNVEGSQQDQSSSENQEDT